MRFYLGSDHAALDLRRFLAGVLAGRGDTVVEEIGPASPEERSDYPDVAATLCRKLLEDGEAFGILVCGSGQGMAMTANRFRGIRAAVCGEPYSARMARAHNDANVLCLGQRVVGFGVAEAILEAFCGAAFEGGRHEPRVAKIEAL